MISGGHRRLRSSQPAPPYTAENKPMATRNTDVNLIIRARNEAGQAINSVAEALKGLVGDAANADDSTDGLATTIARLDKTYAGLAERTNAVREATSRQAQDLHAGNSAIEERRAL